MGDNRMGDGGVEYFPAMNVRNLAPIINDADVCAIPEIPA